MFSKKEVLKIIMSMIIISVAFIISIKIIIGENINNPTMLNGAIIVYGIGISYVTYMGVYTKK
ncbi:MAG: hypothetical protein RR765_11655 [Peptostreptococcaceae bacterium]